MSGAIVVLAEHRQGRLRDVTLEVIGQARQLAHQCGMRLFVVCPAGEKLRAEVNRLASYAEEVHWLKAAALDNYLERNYCFALASYLRALKPKVVLLGHTTQGLDLAPRLAAELKAPLLSDCVAVKWQDDHVEVTRPVYNGKLHARVAARQASTTVVTLRPNHFPQSDPLRAAGGMVESDAVLPKESRTSFKGISEPPKSDIDVTRADILVSAGRGIGKKENLPILEKLAEVMGGVLSSSRPLVDSGWLPRDRQIGQSGKTVAPKLYLACGISGAPQHVAGMRSSQLIIAINSDPQAPIFEVAHYGVTADLFELIPQLTKAIQERRPQRST